MKKSRFTEPQIIRMLQSQQEGKKVAEICREYGISEQTFYNWKSKYGGMSLSELQRVKELEAENARLKRIVADQQISIDILKRSTQKSGNTLLERALLLKPLIATLLKKISSCHFTTLHVVSLRLRLLIPLLYIYYISKTLQN